MENRSFREAIEEFSKVLHLIPKHEKVTIVFYILVSHDHLVVTVEPLNKGHIGIRSTVPCREAVLISEVNLH